MSRRQRRISKSKSAPQAPQKKQAPKGGKSKRRKGLWWKLVLGLAVLLLVAVAVGYNRTIAFLHSEGFRENVSQQVGDELGCEAQFAKFKWNGLSGRNSGFTASGEGLVENVALEDIRVDVKVNYIKRDKFRLKNVKVSSAKLKLDMTQPFAPIVRPKAEQSFLAKLLPDEVELLNAKVLNANLDVHTHSADYQVTGVKLELEKNDGNYDLSATGGRVNLPFPLVDTASIESVKIRQVGNAILIHEAELRVFESGHLSLTGEVDLAAPASYMYKLKGVLKGLQCREVIAANWQQRLSGVISADFNVKPNPSTLEPDISGHCQIRNGVLKALPMLDKIAYYLGEKDYRVIQFDQAQCDFHKAGQEISLSNLRLVSNGLVTVEGQVTISGDKVSGVLNLGLPARYLRNIPGAETIVFKPGKNNLNWTQVKLGGTLENMTEDLSDRLLAAAGQRIIQEALKMTGEIISPDSIEKAQKLFGDLFSGKKGIIDTGLGVIGGIIGSGSQEKDKDGEDDKNDKEDKDKKDEKDDGGIIPKLPKLPGIPDILPF